MYKKKYDDGSFDTKDVNTHQLESYHLTMKNKAETLTQGSSQPEVFNVLGQLQSIERIKKDHAKIEATKQPEQLSGLGVLSQNKFSFIFLGQSVLAYRVPLDVFHS